MDGLNTSIWREEPHDDDAFAAQRAYVAGFDVYGEMLGSATWADMIFTLFVGEAPQTWQRDLLDVLAVALANPGPREPSVHAAMSGAVGGSQAAACLMAALAAGAGQGGGARDLRQAMIALEQCGTDLEAWHQRLSALSPPLVEPDDVWPVMEHPAGFAPHRAEAALPVIQTLERAAALVPDGATPWLAEHRTHLESICSHGLALSGVAAFALYDLGLRPDAGEMLYLLLRLPGAAAHAVEQGRSGFKRFPFGGVELLDDPENR